MQRTKAGTSSGTSQLVTYASSAPAGNAVRPARISPEDMRRFGLTSDQPVTVKSTVGELRRRLVRPFDIRPCNALMYYPEANVLVPRRLDARSRTPAFKSVVARVRPLAGWPEPAAASTQSLAGEGV